MLNSFYQKGMTIIEVIIAMAVLAVIGGALIGLVGQITSANNSAIQRNRAVGYAGQAVEQVRSFRITNSLGFSGLASRGTPSGTCYGDVSDPNNPWPGSSCTLACPGQTPIAGTNFYHWVKITSTGSSKVEVLSTVLWIEKGTCKNTQIDDYLYDY